MTATETIPHAALERELAGRNLRATTLDHYLAGEATLLVFLRHLG